MKLSLAAMAALFAISLPASLATADGVIDGQRGAAYGSAVAVQTVQTQFGDNLSELNAAYTYFENERLFVLLTGNIETNFNKLNIFFDTKTGGENVLSANPDYDFSNDGGTTWNSNNWGGMTFDSGFSADYHMFVRTGGGDIEVDFIDRLGGSSEIVNGNSGAATGIGTILSSSLANNAAASAISNEIVFNFDNTNSEGVEGGTAAANQALAAAVTTGFEFSIALEDLGIDPTMDAEIRIAAMIGNGDHNFLSNQFLGGLEGGTGNLGGDGSGVFTGTLAGIDLNNFTGDQFFTASFVAVPEPGSLSILGIFGLMFVGKRRRK